MYKLIFLAAPSALTLIFTILKLLKKIDWGWMWVVSPIIIAIIIGIIVAAVMLAKWGPQ